MRLREIAALLNAEIEGSDTTEINRVAKIEEAGDGDITFIANPKYGRFLGSTHASAVIVDRHIQSPTPVRASLLRVDDPYLSFLKILQAFDPPKDPLPPGIHPTAIVPDSVSLGHDVRIGAHVVLGERCVIGEGSMMCHGVVLGSDVAIGPNTLLYPNVTVYEGCRLGARVIVHSGTTIGSDGFGFAPKPDGTYEKIPQRGIAVIEDDVEIGANCAVDRATMGETVIRKGAKLDNLIQIAHNVVIGENTAIAAQAGISGSTKIGKNCMIGGQAGFTGHLQIADNTKFSAQAGVHHSVREPGKLYFGSPMLPHREALRVYAALTHLPDLVATVRELKRVIEEMEKRIQDLQRLRGTPPPDESH